MNRTQGLEVSAFRAILVEQQHSLEAILREHLAQQTRVLEDSSSWFQFQRSSLESETSVHESQDSAASTTTFELPRDDLTHPCYVQEDTLVSLQMASKELPATGLMALKSEAMVVPNGMAGKPELGFPVPLRQFIPKRWRAVRSFKNLLTCCFVWLQEHEPDDHGPIQHLVHSTAFKGIISIVIMINAVTLGKMTEVHMQAVLAGKERDLLWEAMEIVFGSIFFLELLLRAAAERASFLIGQNCGWNLFDVLVILMSIFHLVWVSAPNVSVVLRVLRLVRVLRFFPSCRLMLIQILASMLNFVWVSIFLFFILYASAIFFMTGILQAYPSAGKEVQGMMQEYYGTVFETMLSLFMSISGGDDWANRIKPIRSASWLYPLGFVTFIFVMSYGMFNIVTGVFVESAAEASRRDRNAIIDLELRRAHKIAEDIKTFFVETDTDRSGCINRDELETHLQDDRVKAFFTSLEIDVTQAPDLFYLLDTDDSGNIGLDEFLGGCMRLRGTASSMDVNLLLWESEKMMCKISDFALEVHTRFAWLEEKLGIPEHALSRPDMRPQKKRFRKVWTGLEKRKSIFKARKS